MQKTYKSVTDLIGATPLLELCATKQKKSLGANVFAKLEYFNPAGSAKDRVALSIINDAEQKGILKKGGTIIEPTSGNTGIGIASIAASRGYKAVIVMPDTMSKERQLLMKAYGAELVLTDGTYGMQGAIDMAQKLKAKIQGSIIAGQFENKANPDAHFKTTGPEIYNDLDGKVDIFVAGVGTGGTISGVGKFLKTKIKDVKIVAVEPDSSAVLSGKPKGAHALQGIGAGFVPKVLDTDIYDEIICVSKKDAYRASTDFATTEGILVGISSGAALHAAYLLANKKENRGKNIVVLLPDSGERYLSGDLYGGDEDAK